VIAAKQLQERLGSKTEVAKELGITRSKVVRLLNVEDESIHEIILPEFQDDDISAEEILEHMGERFTQRLKHEDSKRWFKVRIRDTKPVGITFIGDPHLGANGCNIPLLRSDIDTAAKTEGVYCINLGDTADNWSYGNLIRLYADNDVSRQTERRLARWFLQDAGVKWIVWLMGNHDTMAGEFSTYLKTINAHQVPMLDWRAKFKLVFSNESEVLIDAAHNHKGTSIYNRLHGQKRAALWGEDADIYVAGHLHNWAMTQEELDDGRVVCLARARGYKWLDDFAVRHGFADNVQGASIMFVIDSEESQPTRRIKPFADIEEGAEYLTWKRSK
jgi:UDP-2,3-diacylglucosamine pyrophosphatase LpxH